MEERLKKYIAQLSDALATNDIPKMRILYTDILTQIAFFQHERLIHLIVTVTFAILALMTLFFFTFSNNIAVLVLFVLFMVLLVPYIRHYYILENGTQKLYTLYDDIKKVLKDD